MASILCCDPVFVAQRPSNWTQSAMVSGVCITIFLPLCRETKMFCTSTRVYRATLQRAVHSSLLWLVTPGTWLNTSRKSNSSFQHHWLKEGKGVSATTCTMIQISNLCTNQGVGYYCATKQSYRIVWMSFCLQAHLKRCKDYKNNHFLFSALWSAIIKEELSFMASTMMMQ